MSKKNKGSKRLGLRFGADGFGLRYKTEFEDGEGTLVNISGGGCAVRDHDIPLTVDEKVLVILTLADEGEPVEVGARVLRCEDGLAALGFTQISEENRKRIVKFFAARQRQG